MMRRPQNDRACRILRASAIALVLCGGCSGPILRPQSPEARIDLPPMPEVKYVSTYCHPYGMNYVKVENISLVTGLAGTGSDPPPDSKRALLLAEMNKRDVENPNAVLASGNTAMVQVRVLLRPGIQAGDRTDVEVRVPSGSETTSLRDGWLLSTRLTEMAALGGQIREGHTMALAEGPVLVDPSADPNSALATRGRILGGGVATKSRTLGLVVISEFKSIRTSQEVSKAVARRFFTFTNGAKQGVANPKTAEFIELTIHPRYKDNVGRYMQVVRNIATEESASALQARLRFLEQQLGDPLTAPNAAIRLEAIGTDEAKEVLKTGIKSADPEVRFYSAEALAYLDDTAAVDVLAATARNEPAFRVNALAALSAMDDVMAYDALRTMLEARSAETRYGAFRALWAMNHNDPFLHDEDLGKQFHYHVLDVPGDAMIHVTRSHRPEIVMFGKDHHFKMPLVLDAGRNILVNGRAGDKIIVSRVAANSKSEQREVSTSVDEVVRAIVELGGRYPDVVQALQQAKADGVLTCRFEVDALPESGRRYDRDVKQASTSDEESAATPSEVASEFELATPLPDLFKRAR